MNICNFIGLRRAPPRVTEAMVADAGPGHKCIRRNDPVSSVWYPNGRILEYKVLSPPITSTPACPPPDRPH